MPEVSFLRDTRKNEIKFYLEYSKMLSNVNNINTKLFLYKILRYIKGMQSATQPRCTVYKKKVPFPLTVSTLGKQLINKVILEHVGMGLTFRWNNVFP